MDLLHGRKGVGDGLMSLSAELINEKTHSLENDIPYSRFISLANNSDWPVPARLHVTI